jgi:Flp pilus assembly protein TadD
LKERRQAMGRRRKRKRRAVEETRDLFGDAVDGSVQPPGAADDREMGATLSEPREGGVTAAESRERSAAATAGAVVPEGGVAAALEEDVAFSEEGAEAALAASFEDVRVSAAFTQPQLEADETVAVAAYPAAPEPAPEPPFSQAPETQRAPVEKPVEAPAAAPMDPLARAKALVGEGRVAEAIALYREIISDDPNSLKARNNLGLLYEGTGQHERALEQFESARAIEPDNPAVMSNVAGALLNLGRFDDAERELRRAMKLDMERVDVRANLGILYYRRGQYALAENELRWVCERDAEHAHAFFYRGEALNRLGKVDKAIEVLERAATLQPTNAKIYHTMGILFDKKNMPAQATQMYKKVRELSR